jgi:hypothetical protein
MSHRVLLLSAVVSGAVLGAADGAAFHYITGGLASPLTAGLWGAGLGGAGAILIALVRRAIWGRESSVGIGTVLGLLYGIVPGLAALYQSVFVGRIVGIASLAGIVMACSMIGLVIGGILDRITDTIVAGIKRHQ